MTGTAGSALKNLKATKTEREETREASKDTPSTMLKHRHLLDLLKRKRGMDKVKLSNCF